MIKFRFHTAEKKMEILIWLLSFNSMPLKLEVKVKVISRSKLAFPKF